MNEWIKPSELPGYVWDYAWVSWRLLPKDSWGEPKMELVNRHKEVWDSNNEYWRWMDDDKYRVMLIEPPEAPKE